MHVRCHATSGVPQQQQQTMSTVPPPKPGVRKPPRLDLRAFQSPTSTPTRRWYPTTLIDSHIHLWTREQQENGQIIWPTREGQSNQLTGPHEMGHYAQITQVGIDKFANSKSKFDGVVFVQADNGSKGGWDASIDEVERVCAAALETGTKVIAIVPWAPVHVGPRGLELYLSRLLSQPSLVTYTHKLGYNPIKSFRYLLQDSRRGFFLEREFVRGLAYLGDRGYAFDMTLDSTHEDTRGPLVLDDAIEAVSQARALQETQTRSRFILDHFAKPDLTVDATVPPSAFQTSYISSMFALALLPDVYLKLSALLDSCDEPTVREAFEDFSAGRSTKTKRKGTKYETLTARILTYLEPAIEAFGDSRIVVGSDWPMFRAKTVLASSPGQGNEEEEALAWAFEMQLYLDCLVELGLEGESLDRIFAGNAKDLYAIGS
ncbi:amidohydrolase family protein [Sporobolomyces koalae]|uniref:amidohydrolase family protein n=1 Tax=Sporobolomyces koalae TaxID=500713 RepID=UPI0031701B67